MQFITAEPYSKREVPTPSGSVSLATWALRLAGYLKVELANIQRGMTRAVALTVVDDVIATTANGLIVADATTGPLTVTLPDPADAANTTLIVIKSDASGNAVTVEGTVSGAVDPTLAARYDSMTVVSDGNEWLLVAST